MYSVLFLLNLSSGMPSVAGKCHENDNSTLESYLTCLLKLTVAVLKLQCKLHLKL